jgi:hypothetical protein
MHGKPHRPASWPGCVKRDKTVVTLPIGRLLLLLFSRDLSSMPNTESGEVVDGYAVIQDLFTSRLLGHQPTGGSIGAIHGRCVEGNRRVWGSLMNSVDDDFE